MSTRMYDHGQGAFGTFIRLFKWAKWNREAAGCKLNPSPQVHCGISDLGRDFSRGFMAFQASCKFFLAPCEEEVD